MEDVNIFHVHLVILSPFDLFYGRLVYFQEVWYIIPSFGILYQGKSGNPGWCATEELKDSTHFRIAKRSSFVGTHMPVYIF
jgi:hypothetical protein